MKKHENNKNETNSEYMRYVITMTKSMHRSLKLLSLYYNIDIKDIIISAMDKELLEYKKKSPEIFKLAEKVDYKKLDN
jgi:hypothetical protein